MECERKHKNVNWAITIIFTILTLGLSAMGGVAASAYTIRQESATIKTECDRARIELRSDLNKTELLLKQYREDMVDIRRSLKEINEKIDSMNIKLERHLASSHKDAL